ncbi:MAG: hypothetical protein OSA99_12185 [Acidimicrobiales bacterium]|nr:hypothetical protein [Acidimicrobiales bacterium]
MTPQLMVLSGLADVRDRFLRTLVGLEEASLAADAGTRTVLLAYRQQIETVFAEQLQIVSELLEGIRVGFGDDPSGWPAEDLRDLSDQAVRMFDMLGAQHLDLTMHLPGVTRTREDLLYMLMRAVGLSLMSREHTRLLSVQESANLAWEASRFSDHEVDQPAAVIAVPWLETHTPLRWPLAIHELGHYFLPGGDADLVRPQLQEVAYEHDWRDHDRDSFREVVADAVAQRAVGDAFAYALAREGYLYSYESHSASGVSVRDRLELLGGPAELLDNLPPSWDLHRRAPRGEKELPATSKADLTAMRQAAIEMVGEIPVNDATAVSAARRHIRAGEPPTAVLRPDADATAALNRLAEQIRHADPTAPKADGVRSETEPMTEAEVVELTGLAVHRSLTDGEILEAAWLEDCERDAGQLIDILTSTPDKATLREDGRAVAERDTWLARALQSAAVHRWLENAADLSESA